jgi:4-hydroxy-tetrahydrodipicolinate synthase
LVLKLEGIWSPMPTPLHKDGSIDRHEIRRVVDFLLDGGLDGLLPLGTTGEFALLSSEERRDVLEAVVDQVNGRVPVVAGVSDPSIENVVRFSKDAKDAGADGVIATPLYYYETNEEGLYEYFKAISHGIDLPLLVYNIPEWTHVFVPVGVAKRLAEEKLVVGMKYTEYNFLRLMKFLDALKGKIAVFTGSDAMAYLNLEFGGNGAIIGVSNVVPNLASEIFDKFKAGDYKGAREIQVRLLPLIEAIGVGQFPAGLKEAMNMIGISVGGLRAPLPRLSQNERNEVRKILKEFGLSVKDSGNE